MSSSANFERNGQRQRNDSAAGLRDDSDGAPPGQADAACRPRATATRTSSAPAAGYTGRDWDYVAGELIKYGYAVLVAWMRNGTIWRRLADKGCGGLPAPPSWEWDEEAWYDVAGSTLVIAVEKFRDTVLATGRWKPDGGASLKTFFIGQCLFRFANPYRSWHAAVTARQREAPDDLAGWEQTDPTTRGPEQDFVQREDLARGLAELDDRTRETLLLLDQGYDQTEVADRMGTTRKAVEMIVRRHRARLKQPPHQPRSARRHGAAS